MPFSIEIVPSAVIELKEIDVFWRRRIVQAIDEQLGSQPTVGTKNRKLLGVRAIREKPPHATTEQIA